ncbi:hypothetical protein [Lysinibacillus sp. BSL11]
MVLYYWNKFTSVKEMQEKLTYQTTASGFTNGGYPEGFSAYIRHPEYYSVSGGISQLKFQSPLYTVQNNGRELTILKNYRETEPNVRYDYDIQQYTLTETGKYVKGSLVQQNIQADYNAYENNARNSDGYWYERGAIVNTAPTMPGAFTQPSGTVEIGDSKVFAVGAASDAEGNLSKYIWEASINGGAFSKVGETTANSLAYTIPTATSLKMRVKAVDSAGLESAYRESSLYTVQPPQYYYDKYTAIENKLYNDDAPWTNSSATIGPFSSYAKSYSFDRTNNKYILGPKWGYDGGPVNIGSIVYSLSGNFLSRHTAKEYTYDPTVTVPVNSIYKDVTKNTYSVESYSKGTLVQTGIIGSATAYPVDGRHTDGFWYVRKSRVNQSIAPPTPFTSPMQGKKFKPNEAATITFGASNAANLSLYEVDYRYNTTGAWTPLPYNNTLTRSLRITTDKALKTLELRVRAKDTSNVYSDYVYSETFEIEHNVVPTVTLTGPGENTTLYENDTFTIAGTAYDDDADQSVTVYYQINSEQRKVLATNLSKTQITLSKQLIFKGGKLFDGEVVLTDTLAEGVPHTLKVWAVDNEGAQSTTIERTFYVVPNRAPLLAIDAVVPSGIINTDKFKISGTASDQDANSNIKVNYRINGANPVEVYNGAGGAWEFEVSLAQLVVNENTIIIEVIDNYDAKTSKTIKLNKNEVKTPILQSVARYKISPPKGSARGVLIWVQRDEELDLKVELSMTLLGEQEQYILLEADPDKIVPVTDGIVEDEYYHETVEPKDNIILKLTTTRPNISIDNKVYLIMGVVE